MMHIFALEVDSSRLVWYDFLDYTLEGLDWLGFFFVLYDGNKFFFFLLFFIVLVGSYGGFSIV